MTVTELIARLHALNLPDARVVTPGDAIQVLCNRARDWQIAARLIALYWDALEEDEHISSISLCQFVGFFLRHPDLGLPRITLTPNNTLRVRWIQGKESFTAIEFIGGRVVKFVAEIPREGGTPARYFTVESFDDIVPYALALGASFA